MCVCWSESLALLSKKSLWCTCDEGIPLDMREPPVFMFAPADKHHMEFHRSAVRRKLPPPCARAIQQCIAYDAVERGDPALGLLQNAIADCDAHFLNLMLAYLLYDACTWVNTGVDEEPGVKAACLRYAKTLLESSANPNAYIINDPTGIYEHGAMSLLRTAEELNDFEAMVELLKHHGARHLVTEMMQ